MVINQGKGTGNMVVALPFLFHDMLVHQLPEALGAVSLAVRERLVEADLGEGIALFAVERGNVGDAAHRDEHDLEGPHRPPRPDGGSRFLARHE